MFRSKLLPRLCFLAMAVAAGTGNAGAQTTLRLGPPRTHVANRPYQAPGAANNFDLLTLNLIADGGIQTAVSWGTTLHLANTSVLEFADFAGTSSPFKSSQPYFNQNFSPTFSAGSATLNLSFFNFNSSASLNISGPVILGQVQIQVLKEPGFPDYPDSVYPVAWTNAVISLAAPGIPPNGSAIQDQYGNNLVNAVGGATITSKAVTPEPSAWLTLTTGFLFGLFLYRRKNRRIAQ